MKSFICATVICAGLFCGSAQAQECQNGTCSMPVRKVVASVVQPVATVTKQVVHVPATVVKKSFATTKGVFGKVRGFASRLRCR